MGEEVETSDMTPDDDPQSELNILRREVRQLQGSVRDATMQVASQQDELIALRKTLTTAELEVEEGLVREANLRMQLEMQSLKRQKVESTMAAADALVSSLREMIVESEGGPAEPPAPMQPAAVQTYPDNPFTMRKETGNLESVEQSKLDRVLNSISDDNSEQDFPPKQDSDLVGIEDPPSIKPDCTTDTTSTEPDTNTEEHAWASPGNTEPAADPLQDIENRNSPVQTNLAEAVPAILRTRSQPIVSHRNDPEAKRDSPPRSPEPDSLPGPVKTKKPNLLLSAFGPSYSSDARKPPVHSSRVQKGPPLPTEVATVAKSEGVPSHRAFAPTSISLAVSDAHSGDIYALAMSSNGWTVSGGDDKVIRVFDQAGMLYSSIPDSPRAITALALNQEATAQMADSIVIFSGGSDGSVRTFRKQPRRRAKWSISTVSPVHLQPVRKIVLSNQSGMQGPGNSILTCSTDRTIRMTDIERGTRTFSVTGPSAALDVAPFGAISGGLIVSGHRDGGLRLWSSRDGNAMIGGKKVHSKAIVSVSCLDDGQSILTLGRDNVMRLSDIRMNIATIREMDGYVDTVSDWHRAAVNGRHVVCGYGRPGYLGVWNVDTGRLVRRVSTQISERDADVLDMVARKLRNPGCVVMPVWTAAGQFACAHRTRQVSFWSCS